ncbi:alpha/beta hydrolase [Schumannella soli]|uniref:Esterase n=1 Tax=Schumannella soli TaxID=2590779 RepID=A0A506Y7E4_9MICO|nr:alpha/beta hydrolase-fold protein [Schumannella soli]TPW77955.1 hypothetical protein FJ657_04770 [Schumannella soli]
MRAWLRSHLPDWLQSIVIIGGPLPWIIGALAALALGLAIVLTLRGRRLRGPHISRPLRATIVLAAAALGAGIGAALCWLLSDQLQVLEVSLSPVSRAWVAAAFAAVAAFAATMVFTPAGGRVIATFGVVLAVTVGALGVNADFGQYPSIGSILGAPAEAPLPASLLAAQKQHAPGGTAPRDGDADDLTHLAAPADQPRDGVIGTVTIPATTSHFAARHAYVYLPPRAIASPQTALPVLILLSGQPGGPDNMVQAGDLRRIADGYASHHDGLAPIIVVPDQLSRPDNNPMCLDSALGNSATYLTVDVPHWILTHLDVDDVNGAWALGGFSQGGTCTIQLGSQHPELFTALLDISGQVAPFNTSVANTIAVGFHGDAAAYRAALPLTVLAARAPYANTTAVFSSGELDARYGPGVTQMAAAAKAAGMSVTRITSPGTAHDWTTVRWSLAHGLPTIAQHLGLGAA